MSRSSARASPRGQSKMPISPASPCTRLFVLVLLCTSGCEKQSKLVADRASSDSRISALQMALELELSEEPRKDGWSLHEIATNNGVRRYEAPLAKGMASMVITAELRGSVSNSVVTYDSGESRNILFQIGLSERVYVPDPTWRAKDLKLVVEGGGRVALIGHLVALDDYQGRRSARPLRQFIRFGGPGNPIAAVRVDQRDLLVNPSAQIVFLAFEAGAHYPHTVEEIGSAREILDLGEIKIVPWREILTPPKLPQDANQLSIVSTYPLTTLLGQWGRSGLSGPEIRVGNDLDRLRAVVAYSDRIEVRKLTRSGGGTFLHEDVVKTEIGSRTIRLRTSPHLLDGGITIAEPRGMLAANYGKMVTGSVGVIESSGITFLANAPHPSDLRVVGPGNYQVLGTWPTSDAESMEIDLSDYGQAVFDEIQLPPEGDGIGFSRRDFYLIDSAGERLFQCPMAVWPWRTPILPCGDYSAVIVMDDWLVGVSRFHVSAGGCNVAVRFESPCVYSGTIEGDRRPWGRLLAGPGASCPWAWCPVGPDGAFRLAGSAWRTEEPVVFEDCLGERSKVFTVNCGADNKIKL